MDRTRHQPETTVSFLTGTPSIQKGHHTAESRFVRTEHRGQSIWLVRRHTLVTGHRIESHIGLTSGTDEVVVTWKLHLNDYPNPNGIYASFPTALGEGWQAWFDTAGEKVEYDAQQLPGACRDFVTMEHAIEMTDHQQHLTLRSPDVPLAMLNGFHFGKKMESMPERTQTPFLLGWVYNNYWGTNFPASEPGCSELTWGIRWQKIGDSGSGLPWEQDVLLHPIHAR
ncbi:MAG: hypothetical protein AAGB22_16190 [Bacteroidota bacterium]